MRTAPATAAFLLLVGAASCATIYVDASNATGIEDGTAEHPYDTIQEGVDAASGGDSVLVLPGSYTENVDFAGKSLSLEGESGAAATMICGDGAGSVVRFPAGSDGAAIRGFTISGGDGTAGGGVFIEAAEVTVSACIIRDNSATYGGGVYVGGPSAVVVNTFILYNDAWEGGGVYAGADCQVINCTIVENTADMAGGIGCYGSSPQIAGCIIAFNRGYGVLEGDAGSDPTLLCNLLWENEGGNYYDRDLGGVWRKFQTEAINLFPDAANEGNVAADPRLEGDMTLTALSPCVDAGWDALAPEDDWEGDGRPADGDGDGTAACDIGADEFSGEPAARAETTLGPGWHLISFPVDAETRDISFQDNSKIILCLPSVKYDSDYRMAEDMLRWLRTGRFGYEIVSIDDPSWRGGDYSAVMVTRLASADSAYLQDLIGEGKAPVVVCYMQADPASLTEGHIRRHQDGPDEPRPPSTAPYYGRFAIVGGPDMYGSAQEELWYDTASPDVEALVVDLDYPHYGPAVAWKNVLFSRLYKEKEIPFPAYLRWLAERVDLRFSSYKFMVDVDDAPCDADTGCFFSHDDGTTLINWLRSRGYAVNWAIGTDDLQSPVTDAQTIELMVANQDVLVPSVHDHSRLTWDSFADYDECRAAYEYCRTADGYGLSWYGWQAPEDSLGYITLPMNAINDVGFEVLKDSGVRCIRMNMTRRGELYLPAWRDGVRGIGWDSLMAPDADTMAEVFLAAEVSSFHEYMDSQMKHAWQTLASERALFFHGNNFTGERPGLTVLQSLDDLFAWCGEDVIHWARPEEYYLPQPPKLQGTLYGYEEGSGYVHFPEQVEQFAPCKGYWLLAEAELHIRAAGRPSAGGSAVLTEGWNLIGCPGSQPVPLAACTVSDGEQQKSFDDAADAGWISRTLYYYESDCGYMAASTSGGDDDALRPWRGYWLLAYRSGLELSMP